MKGYRTRVLKESNMVGYSGINSFWPTERTFGLEILLALIIALVLTL
jgi:hypothetical protein